MKRVTFIGLLLIVLLSSCSSNPARLAPDAKVIKPIKIQKVNKMVGILPTVELSQGPESSGKSESFLREEKQRAS